MSKYNRYQSVITRNSDQSSSEDHWLKEFESKIEKGAVQSKQQDASIFDQINSIMNGAKSKHSSVADVVDDMKERSGLTAYLDKLKFAENEKVEEKVANHTKVASDQNDAFTKKVSVVPILIQKFPNIKNTLENYISETKGNVSIPAIIDKIKSIHKSDVSEDKYWDDDKLIRLVSLLNLKAKKDNPNTYTQEHNLGKNDTDDSDIDISNTDAFNSLNPVKF